MEGSDALSALAEVAIGIAGFSAIALVLSRSRDSLSPDILLVIRTKKSTLGLLAEKPR